MVDFYCEHDRIGESCEDCAYVRALERGTFRDRLDLYRRGEGQAPTLGRQENVRPVIAARDLVIPDENSDIDRGTFVAKGTPVPAAVVDKVEASDTVKGP